MATLRPAVSCVTASHQVATFARQASRASIRRAPQTAQRRCLYASTPLFLDFLAPRWQESRSYSNAPQPKNLITRDAPTQRRAFSQAAQRSAKAIQNPRKDDDGNDMSITITPRAAHRLQAISETDGNPTLALRVAVESGGCHGFQYLMSLTSTSEVDADEDTLFENEEVARKTGDYKAKVVMDEPSLELLKGSSIDYTMELIGSQFKVTGIPGAKSSCGCGTSFDIA